MLDGERPLNPLWQRQRRRRWQPAGEWCARLTSPANAMLHTGRSRKYESVRKNLGIPKDAIENKSVEQLEVRRAIVKS
eukprot:scaffold64_cov248-Pinguiococcus_pyrenoidosus.AAC.8